jgi:hypothetical protein
MEPFRFIDQQRAGRALIAVLDNDPVALAAVLDETREGRAQDVLGLLLATLVTAGQMLALAVGDTGKAADFLRAGLAARTAEAMRRGEYPADG